MASKIIALIKEKIISNRFGRNVFIMFAGTALGQFCSVLLSPILTRIYLPEFFGILGLFAVVIDVLSVFSTLSYELALPLAKSKRDAANLLGVCALCMLITALSFYLLLFFLPSEWYNNLLGSLVPYSYFLPIGVLCVSAYHVMIAYATWEEKFAIISKTKIYQGVTGPVTQIGLGIAGAGGAGLLIGYIIGQSAGFFNMFVNLVLKPRDLITQITRQGMIEIGRRFSRFPLISTWSELISSFGSNNLLFIVIPILYSNVIAGYIFLISRIIERPLLLISTSILQVYIGEAAKTQNSNPQAMHKRFMQIVKVQSAIVALWLIIINATAYYFIPVLFGKNWGDATIYIYILTICYFPQMVMASVTHTLQILEKQALMGLWEFIRFALVIGGFISSYIFALDAKQALLLYSITQALMQFFLFALMYISIKRLKKTK